MRATKYDSLAETQKIVEMFGDDADGDGQIHALVIVDSNVAEANHAP